MATQAHRCIPTGTPLDGWLGGGLPERGVTQVRGPHGVGKSTFLQALLEGMRDTQPGIMVLSVVTTDAYRVSPRLWVVKTSTIEGVARILEANRQAPVLLVDDAPNYASESQQLGAGAKSWVRLIRHERERRLTTVITGMMRESITLSKGTFLGRGADFAADVIIDLRPVARTKSSAGTAAGMVVEANLIKCRTVSPQKAGSLLLWLRPRHKPPMTKA